MIKEIRFGEFVKTMCVHQNEISLNDLAVRPKQDDKGDMVPIHPNKLKVNGRDVYRILAPYTSTRFLDQLKAVVPLGIYLVVFQMLILRQNVDDSLIIAGGLVAVMVGLMLFMEGLKLGLMPFGEAMGNSLPVKSPLPVVLIVSFLLGVGVTFAEPAIGALKAAGKIVDIQKAPYLYALLNQYTTVLVLVVGGGVGLAAILGTLRFVYNWSLKPLIYSSLVPLLGITAYIGFLRPDLITIVGLAWDCGAVTTGPVTVPLVLSLGIGVASAVGKGNSTLSGFGIVTLASLFPIIGVLGLGLTVSLIETPASIIAASAAAANVATDGVVAWYDMTPWNELILAVRAIVPLVIFLFVVMKFLLREKIKNAGILGYGIALAVVGMGIFNVGLTYGLSKLGDQAGSLVPAAFTILPGVDGSPLYIFALGIAIALGFAFFLGLGATLAEPALNALGQTVQDLTNGAFKKSTLMYAVSLGVGIGLALGVAKIIYDWQIMYLILPGYVGLLVLTYFSTEEFVNVAWDSAGVTTGPVTVPLVLAMGLGFGSALGVVEGFGILSMASLCPVMSVLITGLFIQYKAKKKKAKQGIGTVGEAA